MRRALFILLLMAWPVLVFAQQVAGAESDSDQTMVGQFLRLFDLNDTGVSNMRRALLGSVLLGVSCGLLGSFIVVRRMALFGDTLSHAVLPGIMFGFLATGIVLVSANSIITADDMVRSPLESMGVFWKNSGYSFEFRVESLTKNPVLIFIGATFAGLLGGVVVTFIKRATRLKEDVALGLVLAVFYAVGVVLLT